MENYLNNPMSKNKQGEEEDDSKEVLSTNKKLDPASAGPKDTIFRQ